MHSLSSLCLPHSLPLCFLAASPSSPLSLLPSQMRVLGRPCSPRWKIHRVRFCPFTHHMKGKETLDAILSAQQKPPLAFVFFPFFFFLFQGMQRVQHRPTSGQKKKMQGAAMSCLIPSFNCSVITCLNAHSWRASLKKKQQQKSILFKRHSRVEKHCGQAQPVPRFKKSNKWKFPSVHPRTMIRSLSIQNKKAHFAQASDVWIRSGGQKSLQISLTQCHFSSRTARRQRNLLM